MTSREIARDDREDHDRQDQPGDEVVRARRPCRRRTAGRRTCRENHCSAGLSLRDRGRRSPTGRRRPRAPRRAARRGSSAAASTPARAQLGDVERGRDGDRHADEQRDRRRDQRARRRAAARRRCPWTASQSLLKTKPRTPNWSNAGLAPRRAGGRRSSRSGRRTPAARPVRPHLQEPVGQRGTRGDRSSDRAAAARVRVPASIGADSTVPA